MKTKKNLTVAALTAICTVALLASCIVGGNKAANQPVGVEECRGIYYWKTVLQLDDTERQFLRDHDVRRIYLRMFDVVAEDNEEIVPNATIQFKDSMPACQIVPTVYITVDALRKMKGNEAEWAGKILTRVMNICSYNGITGVGEIQVDCDWTETTRSDFFVLCQALKKEMSQREDSKEMALSSTIRLHQLRQDPPPVDCGVLMVYNTGSFLNPGEENSILSYDDVAPYLDALPTYQLHLDFAFPMYGWGLVYRDGQFVRLIRDTDLSLLPTDKIGSARYRITENIRIDDGKILYQGDIVRIEYSDYETVLKVKNAINEVAGSEHSTILYHLAHENISKYNKHEIDKMYE